MTFDLFCSWADRCAYKSGTIEANSHDELFGEMRKFFGEVCGFTGVEAFERSLPSTLKMVMRGKKTKID